MTPMYIEAGQAYQVLVYNMSWTSRHRHVDGQHGVTATATATKFPFLISAHACTKCSRHGQFVPKGNVAPLMVPGPAQASFIGMDFVYRARPTSKQPTWCSRAAAASRHCTKSQNAKAMQQCNDRNMTSVKCLSDHPITHRYIRCV